MNLLKNNVHSLERTIRILLGVVGIALFFVGPKTPLGLIGLIPLATGLMGTCPLYTVFGISTCKVSKSK